MSIDAHVGHRSGKAAPRMPRALGLVAAAACALAVTACGNRPPQPDWQLDAFGSMRRAAQAWLVGDGRIEAIEFARARANVQRTGRIDLLARLELARCAWRVASLRFDDCGAFVEIEQDAAAPERAYAAYLSGASLPAAEVALLPQAQRAVAGGDVAALDRIEDPLSRMVAAGVLMRRGAATPATIATAIEVASAQGWRRPLVAWLEVQASRAAAAGGAEEAAKLRRRIDIVLGGHAPVRAEGSLPHDGSPAPR